MKIIIASDIFGRTPELEEIAAAMSSNSLKPIILDPYQGEDMEFENENNAYAYFQKNVGMEQYKAMVLKKIKQTFNDCLDDLLLIGFSVGASAIWALSNKIYIQGTVTAMCFYGSQIRNYLNIDPEIRVKVLFPEHEPHFDVTNLIYKLSHKKNVKCFSIPYSHGFMNKKSKNFNKTGFNHYLQLLKKQTA